MDHSPRICRRSWLGVRVSDLECKESVSGGYLGTWVFGSFFWVFF
jgi:hypothetical protein